MRGKPSRLGNALGQPIVIANRQGAAGSDSIGIEAVARSAREGCTLLNAPGNPIALDPNLHTYDVDVTNNLDPVTPTVRTLASSCARPTTASIERASRRVFSPGMAPATDIGCRCVCHWGLMATPLKVMRSLR